jgi:hypothetical protein
MRLPDQAVGDLALPVVDDPAALGVDAGVKPARESRDGAVRSSPTNTSKTSDLRRVIMEAQASQRLLHPAFI